jgi:hypothetical protein
MSLPSPHNHNKPERTFGGYRPNDKLSFGGGCLVILMLATPSLIKPWFKQFLAPQLHGLAIEREFRQLEKTDPFFVALATHEPQLYQQYRQGLMTIMKAEGDIEDAKVSALGFG